MLDAIQENLGWAPGTGIQRDVVAKQLSKK